MLLSGYRKEIFRPECNHWFQSLHRLAPLQDQLPGVRPASGLKRCRGDGGLHWLTCGHCEVIRTEAKCLPKVLERKEYKTWIRQR